MTPKVAVFALLTLPTLLLSACQAPPRLTAPAEPAIPPTLAPRATLDATALDAIARTLPPVHAGATVNPYRGRTEVLDAGRALFHQACARCHGQNAEPTPEAPDLRRLNSACRRIAAAEVARHCRDDVDAHFLASVREGKLRAGVAYMPAWEGVLSPQAIWAVRTYLESRPVPPPAVLPPLNADAGVPSTGH